MARVTERIRLGPAALNPFTLHPYEIAGQIAMLDSVSAGRAYLGLAKGAWLDRLGIDEERPLVRAEGGGRDRPGAARGRRVRCRGGTLHARARDDARVPARRAARATADRHWGPDTARWAGTVADEVKIGGTANADLLPVVRGWIGNPSVRLVVGCVTVVDEDGDWARAHATSVVQPYLDVVARHDPTLEPGEEPRLERFCIAGTPEEVAERIVELWEAGADRVELGTPQGRTPLAGVDLICDRGPAARRPLTRVP